MIAGRITDRTTTYGFPNGFDRDGSEFEVTNFSYASRGFLNDFETIGELRTGNFTEGYSHSREAALGSTEHLHEIGGGPALWSGLRNPDGRLTDLMTDNYSWSFDYDTDGKMVELGDFELEYDQWNHLVTVHDTDSGQDHRESYLYDYAGRLVGVVSHLGHSDLWLRDGKNPVERWSASNSGSVGSAHILGEYTWGQTPNQLLVARTKAAKGTLVFPMTDERQSIVGIFNEQNVVVGEYAQYDPDGRVRIRNNTDQIVCSEREMGEESCYFEQLPHFGFTGAFRSQVMGLTLMGARWYSAQIGQFISPDPLWYVDAFDLYAYAAFDPVNRWDPTGLASTGLGNVFRPNEPRSNPADRLLPDRGAQFDGLRGSAGQTPDRRPTHRPGGGRGGGSPGSGAVEGVGGTPNRMLGNSGASTPVSERQARAELDRLAAQTADPGEVASFGADIVPGVSEFKSGIQVFTGRDLITGQATSRWWSAVGAIPFLGKFRLLRRFHVDEWGSIKRGARSGQYSPTGPLASRRVGHTFSKHGSHNTHELRMQARNSGAPQGQWLNDELAEDLIGSRLNDLANGAITVPIPEGLGRVITPDGTFLPATHARIVPSKSGVRTAYPIIPGEAGP